MHTVNTFKATPVVERGVAEVEGTEMEHQIDRCSPVSACAKSRWSQCRAIASRVKRWWLLGVWGCHRIPSYAPNKNQQIPSPQIRNETTPHPRTMEFALIAYSFSPATDFRDPTVILWVRSEESPGEGSDANFHDRFRCTHLCLQVALFTSSRKPVFLDFDYVGSHLYSYSGAVALQICRRAFQHFNRTKWQLCMFLTGPHSLLGDK